MNGCGSAHISCRWNRYPTETMEMDWSHSPQASRQALTLSPEGIRKRARPRNTWRRDLEADVKEAGYTWRQRDWLRSGVCEGVMLAAHAPEGATKSVID